MGIDGISADLTFAQLLRRQEVTYQGLRHWVPEPRLEDDDTIEAVEISIKYEGYIKRQAQQIANFKKLEERRIPASFNYDGVIGFSKEVLEKLRRVRPASVGQASRISGVTPAAISLLLVVLERDRQLGAESSRAFA
jgi:tRNA uridine 5-carboxymethylaminomethyl modification enzyme